MPHLRMFICQNCICDWKIDSEKRMTDSRLFCPKCGSANVRRKVPTNREWLSSIWNKVDQPLMEDEKFNMPG